MIDLTMKLSPHFTFGEMVLTRVNGMARINKEMGTLFVEEMKKLCVEVLEPIRCVLGPLSITSCFRCIELNKIIGGSPTSQHCFGEAADFIPIRTKLSLKEAFNEIALSGIPYSQLIYEFDKWIHIGMIDGESYPDKSGERYIAAIKNGKTVYTTIKGILV